MPNPVIIDSGGANLASLKFALARLGADVPVTADPDRIRGASHVILPGVGAAADAMSRLADAGLDKLIADLSQPVLGICLGMQLMCRFSEEGDTPCLGIFDHDVLKFDATRANGDHKIPHMGWNVINELKGKLFPGVADGAYAYFVHSYYVSLGESTTGITDYIEPFSSSLSKDNFHAVQFHPEKSANVGQAILENFLNLEG